MTVSALALGSLCLEHYFYYCHRSTENTPVEFLENGKQITYPLDRGSYGVVPAKSRQSHPCLTYQSHRVRELYFMILLLTINLRSNIVSKTMSIIISRMSVFGANEW